jgi:hypothetical protein
VTAQQPERSVNDLVRGTGAPADRADEDRRAALVAAAERAGARNPETTARLVADQEGDPDALVRGLKGPHPLLFSPVDLGAGEGRADDQVPEAHSGGQHPFSGAIRHHYWGR